MSAISLCAFTAERYQFVLGNQNFLSWQRLPSNGSGSGGGVAEGLSSSFEVSFFYLGEEILLDKTTTEGRNVGIFA